MLIYFVGKAKAHLTKTLFIINVLRSAATKRFSVHCACRTNWQVELSSVARSGFTTVTNRPFLQKSRCTKILINIEIMLWLFWFFLSFRYLDLVYIFVEKRQFDPVSISSVKSAPIPVPNVEKSFFNVNVSEYNVALLYIIR